MKIQRFSLPAILASSAAAALFIACAPAMAADLTLKISKIETADGNMMIAVYDSQQGFDKTATYRAISRPVEKGEMTVVLADMPAGEYAVMLYQDVDQNQKLDTNMLGIPKEPWSGSLEGRSVFGAPGWTDVNFILDQQGTTINVEMN